MEGNNEITFSIDEGVVRKKIEFNSYYRGERLKGNNIQNAALMQSGEDNNDVINNELEIAENSVAGLISRNLGVCTISKDGTKCNFSTQAVSNFNNELKSSVEGAIVNYLYDKVLEGWLLITMPEEVANLRERFVADMEQLVRLLLERKKPIA